MSVRVNFESQLLELKKEIMLQGAMVERSFTEMMSAIKDNDETKMEDIILQDRHINELELEINERATLMIAKQQPVASDLRQIIVALKVSSDLERMGDLAVDMAKAAKRMTKTDSVTKHEEALMNLASKAQYMMKEVLKAYRNRDVLEAQQIASLDDDVDREYGQFVKSIFNVAVAENQDIQQITQMAFISRYIERIADYCTNIAEWIIYEVNGQRFDLN
ncbi:phosphate signaling complex protein PhoU [Bacillus sp. H-16]|uniref:phosphate signaling complex protein PhoU n=1 Tax=Alteribacter salitolerans TaxID=2912333 RepID=UPI001962993E|nr:phosphate signaling complex protein PhoU [Alteribacter salitolerans]MBM7097616.1 phosphate signaling complex protein PhoU [Alteribacter salitolerans]